MTHNILLIEDDLDMQTLIHDYLQNYDFHVEAFDKPNDALAHLKKNENTYSLVVLDLMLPQRNGYDVCFHLRQHPELKSTKIVMVTAKTLTTDEEKGVFVGTDHYIKKPFEPEELRSAVSKLIG